MPTLNQKLLLRLDRGRRRSRRAGSSVLHHVQAGRVPEALLWQADAAAEKGRPDKAVFYLKQYLEFRPDDHDTAVRLADLMLARAASPKDVQNALFVYERVLREAPQRADVARKLVALCIQMGRFADALEHAQRLLETNKADGDTARPGGASAWSPRAGRTRPAAEYEQAVALAPAHVPAYEQLADLLERHFKKPEDAAAVLDRLTQLNPSRPEAFLARARFLQRDRQAGRLPAGARPRLPARPGERRGAGHQRRGAAGPRRPPPAPGMPSGTRSPLTRGTPTATGPCPGWS